VIYRFDGPITFFDSAYFKQRAQRAAEAAGPELSWFVLDLIPVSQAARKTELIYWAGQVGFYSKDLEESNFPTMRQALTAYLRRRQPAAERPPVEE